MKLCNVFLILLAACPSWSFQIFVRNLEGKTVTIDTDSDERVSAVKEKIEEKTGTPWEIQRLIYQGKQLENDKVVGDYHIQKSSTLHLFLRLKNGSVD